MSDLVRVKEILLILKKIGDETRALRKDNLRINQVLIQSRVSRHQLRAINIKTLLIMVKTEKSRSQEPESHPNSPSKNPITKRSTTPNPGLTCSLIQTKASMTLLIC